MPDRSINPLFESEPAMHDGEHTCSLCGEKFIGWGNNPEPLRHFDDRCCDDCNWSLVIPARIARMR
jgi:hypothetical protein